jgi:hypothetical protein
VLLRWVAAGVFVVMGVMLIRARRHAGRRQPPDAAGRLGGVFGGRGRRDRQPQGDPVLHGVPAGLLRPGRCHQPPDIAAILAISAIVPMVGNLGLALFLDRARRLLSSPAACGG